MNPPVTLERIFVLRAAAGLALLTASGSSIGPSMILSRSANPTAIAPEAGVPQLLESSRTSERCDG